MPTTFSAHIHSFVSQFNAIALVIDLDGQILYCNPYTTRALGWHAYELQNHNFFERLIPAEQRPEITQFLLESVERGGLSEFREISLYAKNGNVRAVQINSLAIFKNDEQATGFVFVGEDVTNKLRVANALNKSNAQLQDLIDNTSDLIQLTTVDGKFTFVNRVWREVLGFETDELPTLRLSDILWSEEAQATMSQLERIKNGEKVPHFETVFKNKQGKKIYLNGSVTCRHDNGKPAAFRYILHDMTSRVRAERSQNLYYSIANWTINAKDLDELYERIHEELGKVIDARNFFIALYDPNKSYMYFPYYVDEYFKQNVRFTKRKLGNGLTEYAIRANKPLFLYEDDIEKLAETQGLYMYGKIPKVMLCVPLRIGDRVTGIIGVKSYTNPNQYRPRNLELLEFISGQVAVAIARKQNEVELNRQTARLNAIFDSSIYLIWSISRAFQLTSFNKNYAEFIKEHLRTAPALNVSTERLGWQMMTIENRRQLEERYRQAFRGQPQGFEMKLNIKGKPEMWLEFSLNPILLASGAIEEVSGVARDITSRKLTELALRQSEGKFRGIFVNLQDIYVRTDRAGTITMISPSVLKRTGYTMDEVLGSNIIQYFVDKNLIHTALIRARREKSIRNFEADLRVKDGSVRQFMFNMLLLQDSDGAPIMAALARDVTEFKRNQLELVKAKEEAERSLKVKERFLANMSHEIRTPMNGIIGMIDLLNDTALQPQQKDYVQTIRRSSETLLNILNDILDLSKIEAGKMALNEAPVSLQEIFDKLTALFSQTAKNKNVYLEYHFEQNLPQFIIADQTRLLQILSNLTSNAIKFTENGKVKLKVSNVWTKGKFHKIKVAVRDSGIGITPDNLKLLFNAFSQVDTSSRKTFGGTGLGLAISKELCRLMKGEIGVESEWGVGSTFWFTFETKQTLISPTQQQSKDQEVSIENYLQSYQPVVLLVDDNLVNRKVASEILRKAGCTVDTADSGKRAIELVVQTHNTQKNHYDAILMDIQMPDMDGIETTQCLRAKFGAHLPPIVAMTAYSMKEDRERFLSQGMDDYIPKPIRAQVLIQKIKELIENRKAPQKHPTQPKQPQQELAHEMAFPVVDAHIVKQLLDLGGMELVVSIFEEFVTESTELVNGALAAFETGDIATIKSNLHTIKGSAGTIGVARLAEVARMGESKLKTNDTSTLNEDLPLLNSEFKTFLAEYQSHLEAIAQ